MEIRNIMITVKEFLKKYFKFEKHHIREDGIEIEIYKPLKDFYVNSLNMETGAIERAKITNLSMHKNVESYEISSKFFKPFICSYDHSLIAYNRRLNRYLKVSPVEILKMEPEERVVYYLIQVNEKSKEKDFIPLNEVKIKYIGKKDLYDLTLDKNYTFIANGIVVQDTMAVYAVNTVEAKQDLLCKNIHSAAHLRYIRDDKFLHKLRHEYQYAIWILSKEPEKYERIISVDEVNAYIGPKFYKMDFTRIGVNIDGEIYPLGLVIFNKLVFKKGKRKLYLTETNITKKKAEKVNEAIIEYLKDILDEKSLKNNIKFGKHYLDMLHNVVLFLSTLSYHKLFTPKVERNDYTTLNYIDDELKHTPKEPILGMWYLNKVLDKVFKDLEKIDNFVYKMYSSGARASKDQIKQFVMCKGFLADPKNIVQDEPILQNLSKGLDKRALFMSAQGSRKGEIDKMIHTPESGYMQRIGLYNLSFITIDENVEDCGTKKYHVVRVKNEKYAKSLLKRWVSFNGKDEFYVTENNYKDLIGKTVFVRSPITCKLDGFKVCKKCSGDGLYWFKQLGIISIQNIVERFTQLILRTFHTSGVANIKIPSEIIEKYNPKFKNGKLIIENEEDFKKYLKMIEEINKWLSKRTAYKLILEKDGTIKGSGILVNEDIVTDTKRAVSIIRKKQKGISLVETYEMLMDMLLDITQIKSIMIETLLTPLWFLDTDEIRKLTEKEDIGELSEEEIDEYSEIISSSNVLDKTLRYYIVNSNSIKSTLDVNYSHFIKLSVPIASRILSPIIHLVFEPNKKLMERLLKEKKGKYVESAFDKIIQI